MIGLSVRHGGTGRRLWTLRAGAAIAIAGSLTAVTAGVSAAQAAPASAKKTAVVKVGTSQRFGKILRTVKGQALYTHPGGPCTGTCLGIWPVLLMPKGTSRPGGALCLATVKFGKRLQVTYRKQRLYTFVDDTGRGATGNGIGGFKVAKLVVKACPKK